MGDDSLDLQCVDEEAITRTRAPEPLGREAGPPRAGLLLGGTRGDHQPAVPFVAAMQRAGLKVRVFAKASFLAMFSELGADVVSLPGEDYEHVFTEAAVRDALATGRHVSVAFAVHRNLQREADEAGCLDAVVEGLREFNPTVIIWHMSLPIEALVASRLCKCPAVCLAFFPCAPTREIPCFVLAATRLRKPGKITKATHRVLWEFCYPFGKRKLLEHALQRHGVALAGADIYAMYKSPERPMICAWSPQLSPLPLDCHAGVRPPRGVFAWSREDMQRSFPLPSSMRDFVEASSRDQLAYIGWGSMGCGSDGRLAELAAGALRGAGARGVVQGGYSDLKLEDIKDPELRDYAQANVFFVQKDLSVPHNWLFPRCGACVHHGGAGTVASCILAGTPSVVTPVYLDQHYWAERVAAEGAGLRGPPLASATADALANLLRECLEDLRCGGGRLAARAESMGRAMREEDGVGEAARLVRSLCPPGRPPAPPPERAATEAGAPVLLGRTRCEQSWRK